MSWARLDDRFPWHPKVLAAGNAAIGLWVRCLVHCCAHATQGYVDEAMAKRMGTARELQSVTDAKLWVRVSGGETCTVTGRRDSGKRPLPDVTVTMPGPGYWIRDFLHYHWRGDESGASATERKPQTAPASSPSRRETRRNGSPSPSVLTFAPAISPEISSAVSPEISSATQVRTQMSRICDASEISTSTSTVPNQPRSDSDGVRTPRAREAADGGAYAPGVGVPTQTPEPSPEPPTDAEQAIVDRLAELGWRSKTRQFSGPANWLRLALIVVRERGLTIPDIDDLLLEARERTKGDPMDLMGQWVGTDHAQWREVLLDRRSRPKHAAALKRGRAAAATADCDVHRNGNPKPIRDIPREWLARREANRDATS